MNQELPLLGSRLSSTLGATSEPVGRKFSCRRLARWAESAFIIKYRPMDLVWLARNHAAPPTPRSRISSALGFRSLEALSFSCHLVDEGTPVSVGAGFS